MTRIISIVSGKGGVGKTTLTINLGAVLASEYKTNTTIVDCNISTSHLGLYLGIYYSPITINKVLMGEANIEESIYEHFTGMKIIPASLSLKDLSGVDVFGLKNAIKDLEGKTDIILLDAAPGLGREALSAIRASDEVLFVTTPFIPAVMDNADYFSDEINVSAVYVNITRTFYKLKVEHNASVSYQGFLLSINASVNFSSTVNDVFNMSMYNFAQQKWDALFCQNVSVSANQYYLISCNVTSNPQNYVSSGLVRISLETTMDE
ncbi:MAG: AAA family ATPase, partial [Candidatus Aenigmatarchaeota archaeon]